MRNQESKIIWLQNLFYSFTLFLTSVASMIPKVVFMIIYIMIKSQIHSKIFGAFNSLDSLFASSLTKIP